MTKETGGRAFPHNPITYDTGKGMTLRQYAAIKLKVPDSGTDWLDEMIAKSLRDDFAAKAMQGMLADMPKTLYGLDWQEKLAESSYEVAYAMMEARSK